MDEHQQPETYLSADYSWRSQFVFRTAAMMLTFFAVLTYAAVIVLHRGEHWIYWFAPISLLVLGLFFLRIGVIMAWGCFIGRIDRQVLSSDGASFLRGVSRVSIPWHSVNAVFVSKRYLDSKCDIQIVWRGTQCLFRTDSGFTQAQANDLVGFIRSRHRIP